jgi:hypothetical protein
MQCTASDIKGRNTSRASANNWVTPTYLLCKLLEPCARLEESKRLSRPCYAISIEEQLSRSYAVTKLLFVLGCNNVVKLPLLYVQRARVGIDGYSLLRLVLELKLVPGIRSR